MLANLFLIRKHLWYCSETLWEVKVGFDWGLIMMGYLGYAWHGSIRINLLQVDMWRHLTILYVIYCVLFERNIDLRWSEKRDFQLREVHIKKNKKRFGNIIYSFFRDDPPGMILAEISGWIDHR